MNIIQLTHYISYIYTYTLSKSQKRVESNYDNNLWMMALAWGACMLFEITWGRWSWISAFIWHKYNVMIKTAIATHIWGYTYWNRHHLTSFYVLAIYHVYLQICMALYLCQIHNDMKWSLLKCNWASIDIHIGSSYS